jgi:membrane protein implicated in regulation of membrane protease activity
MQWWYWIALGFGLIGFELIVPSFTIIWFGIGAIVTGLFLLVVPGFPLAAQISTWTAASALCAVGWFRHLKPRVDRTRSGPAKEAVIGEIGIVKRGAEPFERGIVKFQVALLGDDEWPFFADEPLKPGDRVRVVDVDGHALKVIKL